MLRQRDGDGGDLSLPVRGAWIEMTPTSSKWKRKRSLPVRGAWIEMPYVYISGSARSRSPCGERGLKCG